MNQSEKEVLLNRLCEIISKSEKAQIFSNFLEKEFDNLVAFILALEYNLNKLPEDILTVDRSLIDKLTSKIITIMIADILIRSSGLIDLREDILDYLIFNQKSKKRED